MQTSGRPTNCAHWALSWVLCFRANTAVRNAAHSTQGNAAAAHSTEGNTAAYTQSTSTSPHKVPLRLSLGPLPLIEQRCKLSRGVRERFKPSTSSGSSSSAASQHPHEFVLTCPEDVDEVLDLYFERNQMDADPYWVRAWPSALALATAVLDSPELVRGKRVADLGCGLGVAGMAAALAGAREVVLLDREPLALQCALASAVSTLKGSARVDGLQMGEPLEDNESSSVLSNNDMIISTASSTPSSSSSSSSQADKAAGASSSKEAAHKRWAHLPLSSFWFHGPDLQRITSNSSENRCSSDGASSRRDSSSECSNDSTSDSSCTSRSSDLNSTADGDSSSDNSMSTSTSSDSSRTAEQGATRVWSFPLDWNDQAMVEQLSERCRSGGMASSCSGTDSTGSSKRNSIASSNDSSGSDNSKSDSNSSSQNTGRKHSSSPPFDVVLACDVLYEKGAVEPIAKLLPQLLRPRNGTLLLADPPNRTVANRERFMRLVAGTGDDEEDARTTGLTLAVKEQWIAPCHIQDLDNEMQGAGTSLAQGADQAPVQLHIMQCVDGVQQDTVGIKSR